MNIYMVAGIPFSDELYHHGVGGQKWGVRKYQNVDGSLTQAGKDRYLRGYDLDADKTNQNGSSNQIGTAITATAKTSSGKQFAENALNSMTINTDSGSQASTVANGKESAYKMFGNFKVLKDTNGVTSESIKKALEQKRAKEKEESKPTTGSSKAESKTTETKASTKKTTSKKKTSSSKSSAKKSTSTKKSSSKKSSSKKSSKKASASTKSATNTTINSNARTTVSRSRNSTRARRLETAGNSAAKRTVEDLLKAYMVKTR